MFSAVATGPDAPRAARSGPARGAEHVREEMGRRDAGDGQHHVIHLFLMVTIIDDRALEGSIDR